MRKLKTSITPRIFLGLLVAAYIGLGYMAYILFFPFSTVTVKNQPFPIVNNPVTVGQVAIYTVDYCRYTDVDAEATRTLVGSVSISLGRTDAHLPKGCFKKNVADSIIPSYTPPGQYYIEIDSVYHLSKFRTIEKHFRTADFYVVASQQSVKPPGVSPTTASGANSNRASAEQDIPSSTVATIAPVQIYTAPSQAQATGVPPQSSSTASDSNPPPPTPVPTSPPEPDQHPVASVVKTVITPVNEVLTAVSSLLHP